MTDNEKAIMTDCYKWLNTYNQPPPKNAPDCTEWWNNAATSISELSVKYKNHPLALSMGVAVYEYIEQKYHAINRKRGLE